MTEDPKNLALVIARLLDELGIAYLVGGSLASAMHGRPRTTLDADFVIDLARDQIERLAAALEVSFYVSRDAMREAVREHSSFNAIHLEFVTKVDFFVLGTGAYDRAAFERREARTLAAGDESRVMVSTAEDSVLRKLQWYRTGGEVSEQQWRDVLGVLQVQAGRLDESYLDLWAAHLGVSDLLVKARDEAAGI
jgi:hypothetical protein